MSGFYRDGMAFGYALPLFVGTIQGWTANAAGTRLAMRFVARHSGALGGIALRIRSVTGSPQKQDVKVSLWSVAANGRPGTQLEERDNGSSAALSSNSRLEVTGWTTNLTAGQEYFIVVRNGNASPTTNYFEVVHGADTSTIAGPAISPPRGSHTSTDSGSTWASEPNQRGNYQIIYNTGSGDFTYDWLIIGTNSQVGLNNNPCGVRFTTPSGVQLRVVGVQFGWIISSGGSFAFRIKQDGSTVATTLAISRSIDGISFLPLPDVVTLQANTQTDVEAFLTSGTNATLVFLVVDTTLTPTAFPFQYIQNGSVVAGRFPGVMKLILDPAQPFEVVGGGGQSVLPPMPLVQTFM
jgi:hypothetical protein